MQKYIKKGSILIWAMFLSTIIIVAFVSISSKINKNINNNTLLSNKGLGYNEILVNEKSNFYSGSLNSGKTLNLKFDSSSDLEINLINGSSLYYKLLSFSGAVPSNNIITSSGIIDSIAIFSFIADDSYDNADLYIENLGGFSNFTVSSSSDIIKQYTKYKVIKKIGGKELIKTRGIITNF